MHDTNALARSAFERVTFTPPTWHVDPRPVRPGPRVGGTSGGSVLSTREQRLTIVVVSRRKQ